MAASVFSGRALTVALLALSSYGMWILLEDYTVRPYASFIPLLFAVQVLLSDAVEYYVTKRMSFGSELFTLFLAPGTILHEISHFLVAFVSGCYITGMSLFKPNPQSGMLGYVTYETPLDKWIVLREFAIAFSPFFGCGLLMVLVNDIQGGDMLRVVDYVGLTAPNDFLNAFIYTASSLVSSFLRMDYRSIYTWIILYLQVCFALGAAPSSFDFKGSFRMLYQHPLSTLFTVLFLWLMLFLSEGDYGLMGLEEAISSGIQIFLQFTVTVLLASSALLAMVLPVAFIVSKVAEIRGVAKLIPLLLAPAVYVLALQRLDPPRALAAAAIAFAVSYAVLRYPGAFLKK